MAHISHEPHDEFASSEAAAGFGAGDPYLASLADRSLGRSTDRSAPPRPRMAEVGSVPQARPAARLSTLRFFDGNVHRIAALAFAEAALAFLALYAFVGVFAPPVAFGSFEPAAGAVWPRALLVTAIVVACMSSMGLYQLRQRSGRNGMLARVVVAMGAAGVAIEALFLAVPGLGVGHSAVIGTSVACLAGFSLLRLAFARVVDQDVFKRRVLVWGAGDRAATIGQRLRRRTDQRGFLVAGYVGTPGDSVAVPFDKRVPSTADLLGFVERERIHEIVIAMDDRRQGFPEAFLRECRLRGVAVIDIVQFLERETGRVSVELASPSWLIYSKGFRADILRSAIKRAFDVATALVLLVLTGPIMLLTALAIWMEDRGPIFYRQVRTGQGGRPFKIIKFRSMSVNAESGGKAIWAVRNDPRVTRVGEFIRKVRIDELPQAFNVLAGTMSFVGPRPERPEFVQSLEQTIPFFAERHFAKPGITGWAQVRYPYGASEHDSREKLGYDLYYVMNQSLAFDIMILMQTVEIVLFRIGSR
ncbi:MAG: TIGR03013 family PEP-CTERM/XrtA system glycosyltransferase [Betaproteobacteria bacterium]|nr:TIGR03013 family PEP-CTERM/XrtA system glycosyltransferase [Betaproteobacteria bacterium]